MLRTPSLRPPDRNPPVLPDSDSSAERQTMIRDAARAFAEREIRPLAGELDESERFPAEIY